jgi:GNAT superfamily N-acetyltransferase
MIFRQADFNDAERIWQILQDAIAQRKADGSLQWQDGYPNPNIIHEDIKKRCGYVQVENGNIIGYIAVIFDKEPAYEEIEGKWLSDEPYIVAHRLAIAKEEKRKGIAVNIMREIENIALSENIRNIKVDTNFDNIPMLKILDTLGYIYCGKVYFRGSPRRASQKILGEM